MRLPVVLLFVVAVAVVLVVVWAGFAAVVEVLAVFDETVLTIMS